jgi:predicted ribosomally synthesized peptide with SipW-like signal peptide
MKKKTSKQKGVLAASVLVAGAIVAGGTFAWFTSQDEVVNQLSANNQYNVAITESFKSPRSWIPGQEVEKLVSAVNTGNVDAFVRMSITNSMDLTTLSSTKKRPEALTNSNADNKKENNADVIDYVTLGTGASSSTDVKTGSTSYEADDVTSIQAGGVLAGAWSYAWQDKTWSEITTGEGDKAVSIVGALGTDFKPSANGLYLFKRDQQDIASDTEESSDETTTTRTYTYTGYYYVQNYGKPAGDGTYYALADVLTETEADTTIVDENGYFLAAATTSVCPNVEFLTTETKTVTPVLKYVFANAAYAGDDEVSATPATKAYIQAIYDPDYEDWKNSKADNKPETYTSTNPDNDIIININLSEYADGWDPEENDDPVTVVVADSTKDTWAYFKALDGDTVVPTFYYNKLVAAGATSDNLIDSITLDSSVTTDAYYSFDYNLAIALDSIQVSVDNKNNQNADAVNAAWADDVVATVTTTKNDGDKDNTITAITWTSAPPKNVIVDEQKEVDLDQN